MKIIDDKWRQLTSFTNNTEQKNNLLRQLKEAYSAPGRRYHNLYHVATLLEMFEANLVHLQNPIVVGFSILYHDIVYNTERRDNEEMSAEKARKDLKSLALKRSFIVEVEEFILATKDHVIPEEIDNKNDLAYFLDFDLAVLGLQADAYEHYRRNIRQEYLQCRTHVYKEGRRQAMIQLLEKDYLFYTDTFRQQYEAQARENINNELAELVSN